MELEALAGALAERLFVPVEASGRHVHLTREQVLQLFGHELIPDRPLSQPGQYLARERVSILGPKGRIDHVAVLGPARKEGQVELSYTDGRTLGVQLPLRLSGDVEGTPGIRLVGPQGEVELPRGVIAARRHVHLTPQDAARLGITQGQICRLQIWSDRPVVFGDVVARISPDFQAAVHLDFDEANGCGLRPGDLGRLLP